MQKLSSGVYRIPATARCVKRSFVRRNLKTGCSVKNWATVDVYDISIEVTIRRRHRIFLHVLEGSIELLDNEGVQARLETGQFAVRNPRRMVVRSTGPEPARVLIVERLDPHQRPIHEQTRSVRYVRYARRPAGIRLKSLMAATRLRWGVGYEYVKINGPVPGHRHPTSAAIVLIVSGQGTCTRDDQQFDVRPGMVIHIPEDMWHDFTGKDLVFISIQLPEIGEHGYDFAKGAT